MQLSVGGNQDGGFNRVREAPTTVKNKEFSGTTQSINYLWVLQEHPREIHCRKPSSV
jgi:hypothetical protein